MRKLSLFIVSLLVAACMCACGQQGQSSSQAASSKSASESSKANDTSSKMLSDKDALFYMSESEWWKRFQAESQDLGANQSEKSRSFDAEWFSSKADAFSGIADSVPEYMGTSDRMKYIYTSTKKAANAMALYALEMEQACIEHNSGNDAKATEHAKRARGYVEAANETIDSMTKVMNEINGK